ncbi:MAG: YcfL family protein [Opitutales bacterium]|jgi:uncharacterized protein YcfL
MKKSFIITFTLAMLIPFLSGCTSTVNTVSRANQVGVPNVVRDERILTDFELGKAITIVQVAEATVSGNLAKVQVRLQSNRSRPQTINYAFEWFDLDGMQVAASSSGWKALRFQGKEEKTISSIAPNPKAVDFTLKLHESK